MGIRALKQNASAVVQVVRGGDSVVVTDRGVPVARIVPLGEKSIAEEVAAGLATAPSQSVADMLDQLRLEEPTSALSDILSDLRNDSRS